MALAFHRIVSAVRERARGFDEPLLRPRPRSSKDSRESSYARHVKATAAEACEALLQFGMKDAADQVANIINRKKFLPLKTNGKAVVGRSVLNWRLRLRRDLNIVWMSGEGTKLFPNAYKLFREGKPEAAQRRVLRYLPIYIEFERRAYFGETSTPF